ncbi:MAG TPA: CAP domain-containing protein [Solirubrobacterales bacterium]|nr:CAP domain-containing protein [Solirubrobacterales bacterium]
MSRPTSPLLSPLAISLVVVLALVLAPGASARSFAFHADEVAPAEVCPGQQVEGMSPEEQVGVMLCLTNYARAVDGLAPLGVSRQLGRAAEGRSGDIIDCDDFSHEACGRPFTFWDRRFGYLRGCWKAGENIAWGTGAYATVGAIFTAWLQSPEHHQNILGPYREIGIGLRVGELEGNEGAAVWTQDFGSHKC